MLTSITPLGQRGRGQTWRSTVAAYVLASAAAAAALGALLGLLGGLLQRALGVEQVGGGPVVLGVLAGAALLAAGLDLRGARPPSWRRQVNEDWLPLYRGWVTGAGYGAQLGLGVVTIVTSASVYVALLAELLLGAWGPAAGVGAVLGLARALPVLGVRRVRGAAALARLGRGLARAERTARLATVAALAGAAAVALLEVVVA